MNKIILIPIIIGGVLVTAGSVLLGVAIAKGSSPANKVNNEYELNETINSFDIDADITDVEFVASDSKKLVFEETDKYYHTYSINDGVLTIKSKNEKKWFDFFGFNFNIKATIYLPAGDYSNLKVKNSTGNLTVPKEFAFETGNVKLSTGNLDIKSNFVTSYEAETSTGNQYYSDLTAKSMKIKASTGNINLDGAKVEETLDINASTGRINLKNVTAKNYKSHSSTGNVIFDNTIIAEHLEVETSTGDVKFVDSDAATLKIKTDTGDVKGTLLNKHIFHVVSDTGHPDYPVCTEGGLFRKKRKPYFMVIEIGDGTYHMVYESEH